MEKAVQTALQRYVEARAILKRDVLSISSLSFTPIELDSGQMTLRVSAYSKSERGWTPPGPEAREAIISALNNNSGTVTTGVGWALLSEAQRLCSVAVEKLRREAREEVREVLEDVELRVEENR
jgi:hypothetical protein